MPGFLVGPVTKGLEGLIVPFVCLLILFLGYTSQWLFQYSTSLEPGPLSTREAYTFNALLFCLWWTYYKACTVSPGRYTFPPSGAHDDHDATSQQQPDKVDPTRWCKKCRRPKPLRAHHCRHCGTCIPRMDHHCPWTANCVSLQTFPHFLRFLVYTNASLLYLTYLLWPRFAAVWANRNLPSYLGPSVPAMAHLVLLGILNGVVSLALGILLFTTAKGWALNTTMIEGWEMERHEAVLARHNKGGWWSGAGSAPIERVEYPYDIGIFANMSQAMGTSNPLAWFFPFARGGPVISPTPGEGAGWVWEENGFNDRTGMWPPPDPEKLRRAQRGGWPARLAEEAGLAGTRTAGAASFPYATTPEEEKAAFRLRQEMDLRRRQGTSGIIAELEEDEELEDYDYVDGDTDEEGAESGDEVGCAGPRYGGYERGWDGEPGWTNSEGDRLRDYGVDEDDEDQQDSEPQEGQDQDEDVPLAELIRRRKVLGQDGG